MALPCLFAAGIVQQHCHHHFFLDKLQITANTANLCSHDQTVAHILTDVVLNDPTAAAARPLTCRKINKQRTNADIIKVLATDVFKVPASQVSFLPCA